ncbi:MAG: acetyltransferase [Bacteroidales bacterium]|nr:acetyltransferase [Bacteroidales bacterium]
MKQPVVIFGTGDIAQLAHYYFSKDSKYKVAAFTVDREYLTKNRFCELPVIPFDDVQNKFPPDKFKLFIALSYSKLNQTRKEKYLYAKSLGYSFANYISSKATILNDGKIGDNCFIFEDNTIQPFVSIGDNVTIWSGNHIGHHSIIHNHCFISSHVVISGGVEIGESCFIGVNATLRDHIKVGEKCLLGAGTLLLSDAEPESLYIGKETERSDKPSTKIKNI